MRNTYPQPPNTTFYAETLPAPATSSSSHHHHPQIHPPPSSQSQTLPGAFPTSTATTPISITTTPPININNSYHHQQQQQHHQHQHHQQQQQQHQQLYHHQQQTSPHSTLHHQQQQQNNNHQQQLQQKPHPSSHHQIHLSSHHQPHLTSHHQPHSSPLLQTNHQQHSSPNQHQQKHSSPHPPPLHQPPQLLSDQQSGLPQYTPNSHSHASLNPTHSHASPQPTLSLAPPPPPPITIKQQTTPPLTPYAYDIGGGGGGVKVSSLRQEPKGLLKKEVYEYKAPWPVYGLDWSKLPGEKAFRLAVGSFIEEYSNKLEIISLAEPSTYDDDSYYHRSNIDFVKIAEADHHYPITKVLWEPYKGGSKTSDLLATTGDYLKLWEIVSDEANNGSNTIGYNNHNNNKTVFNKKQQLITKQTLKNKKVDFKAPLTSFDWNQLDSSLAVTSSIDTTCTVWNVETGQAKTQLIAHDKEVYDVAFFTNEVDTFASVGADGSVRLFDLRSLEHSTILYETPPPQSSKTGSSSNSSNQQSPLLRLSFNKISPYYIATFHMNSTEVIILDIRAPGLPVAELNGHNAPVNCVNWSPNSSNILCSGGDDCNAIVWDLGDLSTPNSTISKYNQDPLLAYRATSEVNQLSWNTKYPEWVSIIFGKTIQALKI